MYFLTVHRPNKRSVHPRISSIPEFVVLARTTTKLGALLRPTASWVFFSFTAAHHMVQAPRWISSDLLSGLCQRLLYLPLLVLFLSTRPPLLHGGLSRPTIRMMTPSQQQQDRYLSFTTKMVVVTALISSVVQQEQEPPFNTVILLLLSCWKMQKRKVEPNCCQYFSGLLKSWRRTRTTMKRRRTKQRTHHIHQHDRRAFLEPPKPACTAGLRPYSVHLVCCPRRCFDRTIGMPLGLARPTKQGRREGISQVATVGRGSY